MEKAATHPSPPTASPVSRCGERRAGGWLFRDIDRAAAANGCSARAMRNL